jgi:hypothetical protein
MFKHSMMCQVDSYLAHCILARHGLQSIPCRPLCPLLQPQHTNHTSAWQCLVQHTCTFHIPGIDMFTSPMLACLNNAYLRPCTAYCRANVQLLTCAHKYVCSFCDTVTDAPSGRGGLCFSHLLIHVSLTYCAVTLKHAGQHTTQRP